LAAETIDDDPQNGQDCGDATTASAPGRRSPVKSEYATRALVDLALERAGGRNGRRLRKARKDAAIIRRRRPSCATSGGVLFRTPVVGVNPLLSADGARTPQGGLSMSVVWIVGGVAVLIAIAKLVGSLRERAWESDLGFVSHQWITEHRLSQTSESQR
jgi:hypothetical protein